MKKPFAWAWLEQRIGDEPVVQRFRRADLAGSAEPVRRYFGAAVAEETPLAAACRLRMRGHIKLNRWLPFRAKQLLAPRIGTVWAARITGVITGSDRYVDRQGAMDWRLLGLVSLVHAEGEDISRSAAGRAAGESVWVPTALAPVNDSAQWHALDENHVAVDVVIDGRTTRVEHEIDKVGRVKASHFERWGDPDNTGTWGLHPFGLEATAYRSFAGIAIPSAGRAGWHFGTDRWESGVFFRYQITRYELAT